MRSCHVSWVFPRREVGRRYDRDGPVCDQVEVCLCNRRRLRRVALFFQPLFLQIYLFVFRARGIADRLHALEIGIRDIRQILNPLRDILHALNRRVLQRERSCSTQEYLAVG